MGSDTAKEAHEARAMELADRAMTFGMDGDHQAAQQAWQEALDYAERHLPGETIVPWIQSGLGESLLRNGDYHRALTMAGSALEFCASMRAPSASITMAKACLRLGDVARAREHVGQACELKGEKVLAVFSAADRDALDMAASG